jgi:putative membrane protein
MTDKFGVFEKLVFSIPDTKKLLTALPILASIYGVVFFSSTLYFTSIELSLHYIPLLVVLGFILPFLITAELFHFFLQEFPRKWGYFAALVAQFLFFVYMVILTGADNVINAWHIFWIALLTLYLFNLFVMLITRGYRRLIRINLLSLIQPLTILAIFHLILGKRIQITSGDYISSFVVMAVGAAGFMGIFAFSEHFIRVNAKGLSVANLVEGLVNKKERSLDLGYSARPEVQTLKMENAENEVSLCVPWVHPGPIEGFGGGRLTSKIIDELNQKGTGFFLHVPSTHKSDLADPSHYEKIMDAMKEPERAEKSSKLVKKEYEDVEFYGRRIGDQKMVFMDADYDDYEISIFKEVIDLDDVPLVDLHNHDRHDRGKEVWHETEEAENLRQNVLDFLTELEDLEVHQYNAGISVNLNDRPVFALVEDVDDEETLIFGVEGNGTSKTMRDFSREIKECYDNVIYFSTDTHSDIHEYREKDQVRIDDIKEAIEKADENISKAEIGFKTSKSDRVRMLREDYFGLIHSVNILIRLMIFSAILFYLIMVIWIFF